MRINVRKEDEVMARIVSVQKGCRVRTVNYEKLCDIVEYLEKRLTDLMPKKYWQGFRAEVDPFAEKFANSYKGIPESTQLTLERGDTAWFLVSVERAPTKQRKSPYTVVFSETHKEKMTEFIAKNF
jgi:hypothetical protein